VVDRHAQGQLFGAVGFFERQQRAAHLPQGLHGVGQHQGCVPARQHLAQHGGQVLVHERLAAGKANFPRGQG